MERQGTWDKQAIDSIVSELASKPGALMLVLHEVQNRFGYIPRESVAWIAKGLNLSRADVHGVVTFYRDFRTEPPGRHIVKVCLAESCQAMGALALASGVSARLHTDFHETSKDGEYTLEPVYCLGNCACSPAVMVDADLYGRVDRQRFGEIIAGLKDGRRQ